MMFILSPVVFLYKLISIMERKGVNLENLKIYIKRFELFS